MFIFGALADVEDQYTRLALDLDAMIVGIDYRKAPENPFPAAAEDCYAGVKWLAANANKLGIDASRIAIAGASAGGTLTASVALMARDRGGPKIAVQFPIMAALDDRMTSPSANAITDERMANHDILVRVWDEYLGPMRQGPVTQYAAPARAADLSGLPPSYVYVAELDPMRDENIEFATRLMQAGVTTELHVYPGAFHQFAAMAPNAGISKRAHADFVEGVKRAFAGGTSES
jgi:acetyl esterase/lipase